MHFLAEIPVKIMKVNYTLEQLKDLFAKGFGRAALYCTELADLATLIQVAGAVKDRFGDCFLFESIEGGDKSCSFNISTCSSFVVAAGGVKVAKHGNTSVSSKCGAADVLTALGANVRLDPERAGEVMDKCNFMFLHAQVYHPAMKYAAPVRNALGVRTMFNILGPLANPARARMQLLGVYSKDMVVPLARVLSRLGTKRVIAVYGCDALDEVSLSDSTYCCEIIDGVEREYYVTPEDFGLNRVNKSDIVGGEPDENARIMRDILSGVRGPCRDSVVANSAMCFYLAGKVSSLRAGALMARSLLDSGAAYNVFSSFVEATNA